MTETDDALAYFRDDIPDLSAYIARHRPAFLVNLFRAATARPQSVFPHELQRIERRYKEIRDHEQHLQPHFEVLVNAAGDVSAKLPTRAAVDLIHHSLPVLEQVSTGIQSGQIDPELTAWQVTDEKLREAMQAGEERRTGTQVFRLADLEARKLRGEFDEDSRLPNGIHEPDEERVVFRGILNAERRRSALKARFARLVYPFTSLGRLFSRGSTITHPDNKTVSNQHATLTFSDAGKVRIIDMHRKGDQTAPGTQVYAGKNAATPVSVEYSPEVVRVVPFIRGRVVDLIGYAATVENGHEFSVGKNRFRVNLRGNRFKLIGVAGPVRGRRFKFNTDSQREVLIGYDSSNDIVLKTRREEEVR